MHPTKVIRDEISHLTIDEDGVRRGLCLICDSAVPLDKTDLGIGRHAVAPELMGNHAGAAEPFGEQVICIGTGHPRCFGDGRDDNRRVGVRYCVTAETVVAEGKARIDGLDFAAGIDWMGESVMVHGFLARHWRIFAVHGSWATGMRDALRCALDLGLTGNAVQDSVKHMRRLSGRQWLRQAQPEIMRAYAEGLPPEDLGEIFFSI